MLVLGLVERFANDWPLAPDADMRFWYAGDLGAEGYTSYPRYEEAPELKR